MEKTPTEKRAAIASSDLLAVLRAAEAAVPEGYRIAKDTLPERVKLMAEGLMSFMADREELRQENAILRGALEDIGEYTGDGGPSTPWRDIVRDCGNKARDAISSANVTTHTPGSNEKPLK